VTKLAGMEKEFIEALEAGFNGLQRAGTILVEMQQADPTVRQRLVETYGIQHSVLTTLEKIGRGVLLPRIAIAGGRLTRLAVEDQKRALDGTVPALVLKDGGAETIQVNLLRAPKEIQEQLLNGDHIRTLDEQRAYLAGKSNQTAVQLHRAEAEPMPWKVSGKTIDILRPIRGITRGMLLTMMKALEG